MGNDPRNDFAFSLLQMFDVGILFKQNNGLIKL